jgi:hypothetical protein
LKSVMTGRTVWSFRRLAWEAEQLGETFPGLHFVAFALLMLKCIVELIVYSE